MANRENRFVVDPPPELRARLDSTVKRLQEEAEKQAGPGRVVVSRSSVVCAAVEKYLKELEAGHNA